MAAEVKKSPTKVELKAAERRMVQAKAAFILLSPEERRKIFLEFGSCTCAGIAKAAREHPAAAIGGLIGAGLGVMLAPKKPAQLAPVVFGDVDVKKLLDK